MLSFKRTPQEQSRNSFLNYQTGAKYVQQTDQRMLSSEFGIKPNVIPLEFADINAKFNKILLKLPELSHFQKDAIIRTAFANDNSRQYQKNGTILSMIDSYVGSGKTKISLIGGILYTLKEGLHLKESLTNEATKCNYYSDLDPRCSPLYCKGYRNIVAVCANHDLLPQWQKETEYVIHCIKDVVEAEFGKRLSMHIRASGKLQGDLKKYNEDELIILIMKQQTNKVKCLDFSTEFKFLYDGNTTLNQIPDHSDKSNLNPNNFANIACSVLIADEAHLPNSIVQTNVQPYRYYYRDNSKGIVCPIVQRERLPILLASHVIGVSASLSYKTMDWWHHSNIMLDRLVLPRVLLEIKPVIPFANWEKYFNKHVASCIRCDHRMLQTYYENIKNIKICTLNSHVPKGLGECEFELTNPKCNFKLFTDMMQKRYNIEISKDVFEQNLDINNLISSEKDNIDKIKSRICTIQDELKGQIPDDNRDKLTQLLKNQKELLEKKQIGIDNFIEFTNNELECCICLETVNGDDDKDNDALMCSKCMKLFHRRCKKDWDNTLISKSKKPSCPLCREEVVGNQIAFVSKSCSSTDDTIMVEDHKDTYNVTSLITLGEYMKEKMNNKSSQDSHLAQSLKGRISIVMTELFKFLNYNQNRFLKFMLVCKSEQETDIIEYFNREFKQYIDIEQLHIEIMKGAGTIKDGLEQRERIESFSKNGSLLLMMTFDSTQCNSITGVDIPDLDGLISIGSSHYIQNDDQRAGRLIRMSRRENQQQKLFINIRSFSAYEIRKMKKEESETTREEYRSNSNSLPVYVGNTCSSSSSNTNSKNLSRTLQQQIALTQLNQLRHAMQLTQASSNSGKRKHSDIIIDKDDEEDDEEEEIVQAQKKEKK